MWGEELHTGPLPRNSVEEAERASRQLDDQVGGLQNNKLQREKILCEEMRGLLLVCVCVKGIHIISEILIFVKYFSLDLPYPIYYV